jgi:hypothetical protein
MPLCTWSFIRHNPVLVEGKIMGNELLGAQLTLHFQMADINHNATTVLQMPSGGNTGFLVPTGYTAHAMLISAMSNTDLTAGTATFVITDDGTAIDNGPTCVLSDLVQEASGVKARGAHPVPAGSKLGVSIIANAAMEPETAHMDAIVYVELHPA